MRKLAVTAYGLVGFDHIRMTAAILDDGSYAFVRADGSNSPVPTLPTTFRTCGDIGNVAAKLGHRVDMAAVPKVGLPNHEWKTTMNLEEIIGHFVADAANAIRIQFALEAAYAVSEEAAA